MTEESVEIQQVSYFLDLGPPPTSPCTSPLSGPPAVPGPQLGNHRVLSRPTLQAPCYYCLPIERAICKIKVASCLGLSRYVG